MRVHLLVLALAAGAPLAVLLVYATHRERVRRERLAGEAAAQLATFVAADLQAFVRHARATLDRVARRPLVRAVDASRCDPFLAEVPALVPGVTGVGVMDARGRARCVGAPVGAGAVDVSGTPWFPVLAVSDSGIVSAPHVGPVTGRWVMVVAVPLRDAQGAFRGAVAMGLDLPELLTHGLASVTPSDLLITVVDAGGVVVTRSAEPERWVGRSIADSELLRAVARRGAVRARDPTGEERVYGIATIPETGWRVFVGRSVSTLMAPLVETTTLPWLVIIPILVLGAALAWVLGGQLARPAAALAAAVDEVASGQLDVAVPVRGSTELRRVAERFNAMADARRRAEAKRAGAERALREAASRYRLLFDRNPVPMWLFDPTSLRFLAVNDAALTHYGWSREEFLGLTLLDVRPPEDRAAALETVRDRASRDGLLDLGVLRHCRKDGSVIEVAVRSDRVEWGGRPAILAGVHDVTEQRRAATRVAEAAARLEAVVRGTNVGVWEWDLVAHRVRYSPEWKTMLGYAPDEIPDEAPAPEAAWHQLVHPDDRDPTVARAHAVIADPRRRYEAQFRLRHKDGSWHWILDRGIVVRDADGTPLRFLGTHVDLTPLRLKEEALRESEARLRAIVESEPECVKVLGPGGTLVEMNPSGLRMIEAASLDDVRGADVAQLVVPEFRAAFQAMVAAVFRGEDRRLEFQIEGLRGTRRWLETHSTPLRDASGKIVALVGVTRDVTGRHEAEAALRQAYENARRLAAGLEQAREGERTRLARAVHDELGQALTGLKMDVDWLRGRRGLRRDAVERLGAMAALLDETVDTVRRIAGELRPGVLDDLGLAAAVRWQAREFAKRSGIDVRAQAVDLPHLEDARATAIFRVLQEALTNVARHADARRVTIRLAQEEDAIVLEVEDDGRGITAADVERPSALGVLGMRERVHPWDGTVAFQGRPGAGTTVTVRVPLAAGTAPVVA
jgi:PAS domain S-box-containing protein